MMVITLFLGTTTLSAQNFGTRTPFSDHWKFELRTGSGILLSSVPEQYLPNINHVNIPLHTPGPVGVLAVRKGLMAHLEMGYQLDIIHVQGKVEERTELFHVRTTAVAHNFLVIFNLKSTQHYIPRTNFSLYYKAGAINLKNLPRKVLPDGSLQELPKELINTHFMHNLAIGTGIGVGTNRQLTEYFSFTGALELNRSSDLADDVYKPGKLFYNSPNKVNNYITLTAGICYTHNFSRKKSPVFFVPKSETHKRLIQHKKIRNSRKGR